LPGANFTLRFELGCEPDRLCTFRLRKIGSVYDFHGVVTIARVSNRVLLERLGILG